MDIWRAVEERRIALAERVAVLDAAQWNADSWCEGWRVRDVVAHLVHLAEATQWSKTRDLLTNGVAPNKALDRVAQRLAAEPQAELASRLKAAAGGRYHVVGSPAGVALGEVITHAADMLRPLGLDDHVDPSIVVPVLPVYRRVRRLAFQAQPLREVRLVATDTDWTAGEGLDIRGRAVDLLLLLANRAQVVDCLDGPGVSALG
jgi:uncharacterized protein (TIGR03083 family)